jgi:putative chitinase
MIPSTTTATLESHPDCRADLIQIVALQLALSGVSTKMAAFAAAPVVDEKEVVPVAVDRTVKKKFNVLGWLSGAFGGGGLGLTAFAGFDWKALIVIIGFAVSLTIGVLAARKWVISAIKEIRQAVEE